MKLPYLKILFLVTFLTSLSFNSVEPVKDFQGKATYISKSTMNLGKWGARMSEMQKKQIKARLKNRLEKTYTLTFNKQESFFKEDDKIDAISGATDSWGKNFTPGEQYKNVKTNTQIQHQEFYGKNFLVKDSLQKIEWKLDEGTKQIGNYTCFKATASIPTNDLTWYSFSWSKLRNTQSASEGKTEVAMTEIVAWYSPKIPVSHGPQEFWGLPGLILEASFGNTTLLCSELVLNPKKKVKIKIPEKGEVVTKNKYREIIFAKMKEFRDIRSGRRRGRR